MSKFFVFSRDSSGVSRILPVSRKFPESLRSSQIFSCSFRFFRIVPEFAQILSDPLRIWSNSLVFFRVLFGSRIFSSFLGLFLSKFFVISRIHSDSIKFCRISHVLGFSRIFSSSVSFFRSLSDYLRFFVFSRIFSRSHIFFRRLSDSLGSSQNFLEFYAILTKFDRNLPYSFESPQNLVGFSRTFPPKLF